MKPLVFFLPGQEDLAAKLTTHLDGEPGNVVTHSFPDGETYLRVASACRGREVVLLQSLDHPNKKILPLLLLGETLRDLGANRIRLVCPYLSYMRQDKQFQPGEGVTSRYFAKLVSTYFDGLLTMNPHLHRYHSLSEIYSIPSEAADAGPDLAKWIKSFIKNPVLIGPDGESEQWVANIAGKIQAPYRVAKKERWGDREVRVSMPDLTAFRDHHPVLIDDIISTGHTLIQAVAAIQEQGLEAPICLGIHALFAPGAEENLKRSGVQRVVTTNTIAHSTNGIDISETLARSLRNF